MYDTKNITIYLHILMYSMNIYERVFKSKCVISKYQNHDKLRSFSFIAINSKACRGFCLCEGQKGRQSPPGPPPRSVGAPSRDPRNRVQERDLPFPWTRIFLFSPSRCVFRSLFNAFVAFYHIKLFRTC